MISVAAAVALVVLFLVTIRVLRPIGRIVAMSRKIIAGDLTARVGIRPRGEIGLLCHAVDAMADAVAQRETLLKQATRQQVDAGRKTGLDRPAGGGRGPRNQQPLDRRADLRPPAARQAAHARRGPPGPGV